MLCYGALCEFFAGRWAKAGQVAAPVGSSFCFAFFCCNIHDVCDVEVGEGRGKWIVVSCCLSDQRPSDYLQMRAGRRRPWMG